MSASWIQDLPRIVGASIGIGLVAIGTIMILNVSAQMFLLGYNTPNYFDPESECQSQRTSYATVDETKTPDPLTGAELETCIEKQTALAQQRYNRDNYETLILGASFLIVGAPLWIALRPRSTSVSSSTKKA